MSRRASAPPPWVPCKKSAFRPFGRERIFYNAEFGMRNSELRGGWMRPVGLCRRGGGRRTLKGLFEKSPLRIPKNFPSNHDFIQPHQPRPPTASDAPYGHRQPLLAFPLGKGDQNRRFWWKGLTAGERGGPPQRWMRCKSAPCGRKQGERTPSVNAYGVATSLGEGGLRSRQPIASLFEGGVRRKRR